MAKHQERCYQNYERQCVACESTDKIEVHHIDGDSTNNQENNLIPLCEGCHWDVERECFTDDVGETIDSDDPLIIWLVKRKRSGSPRSENSNGKTAMVSIDDETRDELRKYKAEHGDTYTEAVDRLLGEVGWADE
jgi:nucleoside-triphosphatase THEP1